MSHERSLTSFVQHEGEKIMTAFILSELSSKSGDLGTECLLVSQWNHKVLATDRKGPIGPKPPQGCFAYQPCSWGM